DDESGGKAEAHLPVLGRGDEDRLKRREVVPEPLEAAGQEAAVLDLGGEELDRHGQAGGGQDLLVEAGEDLLGGQVFGDALAEGSEEVRLLDVLLPVEDGAHEGHSNPRRRPRVPCPSVGLVAGVRGVGAGCAPSNRPRVFISTANPLACPANKWEATRQTIPPIFSSRELANGR